MTREADPFTDHRLCPWCSGETRYATSDEWIGKSQARICTRCDLVFTRGAKREWNDSFYNPNLKPSAP